MKYRDMDENNKWSYTKLRCEHEGLWFAISFLFFVFWLQSGWYRVDCGLGVEKACALIKDEYAKRERP